MSLTWNESIRIGNDQIDDDHKKLIAMVNNVEKALTSAIDSEEITNLLHDLDNFTAEHFRREERFMKQINYPEYHQHFCEHKNLLDRFTALKNDIILNLTKNKRLNESEAMIDLLRNWLIDHVINEDILIKPYLK